MNSVKEAILDVKLPLAEFRAKYGNPIGQSFMLKGIGSDGMIHIFRNVVPIVDGDVVWFKASSLEYPYALLKQEKGDGGGA